MAHLQANLEDHSAENAGTACRTRFTSLGMTAAHTRQLKIKIAVAGKSSFACKIKHCLRIGGLGHCCYICWQKVNLGNKPVFLRP